LGDTQRLSKHQEIGRVTVFLGLDPKTWLGLAVVGSIVSTFGALFGVFLKDYFFARSFERWKQRTTLEQLYQRYCDPLRLSARELVWRTIEVLDSYPSVFLTATVLASRPSVQKENSTDDPYFRRYKLLSTTYRFCALLGWLELYRQEITYLQAGSNKRSNELERVLHLMREDLANGQLNRAKDWLGWRDVLVFREELRAIGESMIENRNVGRTVMGYGRFVDLFNGQDPSPTQRWAHVLLSFLLDLGAEQRDFRRIRLQRLVVHLVDLLVLLDKKSVETGLLEVRQRLFSEAIEKL
jgi:hypothetical protein